jgi:RNA polymerase-binding transcription factor DksA
MSQLACELALCVQLIHRTAREEMTGGDEIRTALSEKLDALHTLRQNERDGIAAAIRNLHMASLVSDALERAENDTYGLCAACAQRISPRRLAALPWARYCIACQEMKEGCAAEVRWKNAA